MILKSFGCSFIFGNELADDGFYLPKATPSRNTWPALLAQHLDCEYQCHARPGSGNQQILARLLDAIDQDTDLFVIGWSWIDRFDYCNFENNQWKSFTPAETSREADFYYKNFHSQYQDKLTTLIYIKSAIDALRERNRRFIMTYMDALIYETQWHTGPGIAYLQDCVRPCLENFEGKNFLDWSHDRGYPIGSRGKHPLEEAHRAAFDLIASDLDRWIKH